MIKKFENFNAMDSVCPYYGFYDAANGHITELIQGLDKESIEYEYDSYRNFLVIKSFQYGVVNKLLDKSDIYKVDFTFAQKNGYFDNPNDCVQWLPQKPIERGGVNSGPYPQH